MPQVLLVQESPIWKKLPSPTLCEPSVSFSFGPVSPDASTSDSVFKDDQQPVSIDDCLQVFNNLTTKTFIRNDKPEDLANGIRSVGFVAQDLQNDLPSSFNNLVYSNENYQGSDKTILSIDYGLLTSILWEVVRWQGTHIQNLEDRLTAIENKLSNMNI